MTMQQTREKLRQVQQEERRLQQQLRAQEYASQYPVRISWPSPVTNAARTNVDLIQYRLLEAGVLYDVPTTLGDTIEAASRFVQDLERTDAFESVKVTVDKGEEEAKDSSSSLPPTSVLKVTLKEKRWYRLHAGAGIKTSSWQQETSPDSFLPKGEVEFSAGLRNLTGCLDQTALQYSLDTMSVGAWKLVHERPLYTVLPESLQYVLLEQSNGSQISITTQAVLDTVDHEYTRSYKEYQRMLSARISNTHSVVNPEQYPGIYYGIEWTTLYRDLVPRRQASVPYYYQATPEVVSQAGPSVKHSFAAEFRLNGTFTDHPYNPSEGIDLHAKAELATPPGDVGFIKGHLGLALHVPLTSLFTIHGILKTGILHPLSFGGLCQGPGLSDRFYVGGPLNFRGFSPSGVGPRVGVVTGQSPGDALGGNLYYTATVMASMGVPTQALTPVLAEALHSVRLFSFATVGTCTDSLSSVWQSTRSSIGLGLATSALGPRLETTFSWPLRQNPADVTKAWQLGFGFTI